MGSILAGYWELRFDVEQFVLWIIKGPGRFSRWSLPGKLGGPKTSLKDELRKPCCLYSSKLNPKSFTIFS